MRIGIYLLQKWIKIINIRIKTINGEFKRATKLHKKESKERED